NMAAPLKQLFSEPSSPAGRVFALHLLDHISALDESTLLRALDDFHPGVRENAVMLAATRMQSSAEISEAVLALADDPDPHVRFQCALALGKMPGKPPVQALARIASQAADDKWTRAAVLNCISGQEVEFARLCPRGMPVRAQLPNAGAAPTGVIDLVQESGRLVGATVPTNNVAN